jgi:hypothetical protein
LLPCASRSAHPIEEIHLQSAGEEIGVMAKKQQRQVVCMVFLVAFLVISAMHAVPAEAGRLQSHVLSSLFTVVNNF